MTQPADLFWMQPEGDLARLGVTALFVEQTAGDWLQVELPAPGARVRQFDTFGFVQTTEGAYDLRAPVSFEVASVNEAVSNNAQLVRLSPMGDGWLLTVRAESATALV